MEEEFKDDLLAELLKKGARDLPNTDFDNQMMRMIDAEVAYKKEVATQLKTSFRFFISAIVAVLSLALIILFGRAFMQYNYTTTIILIVFIMSVGAVVNLGNYRRILKMY